MPLGGFATTWRTVCAATGGDSMSEEWTNAAERGFAILAKNAAGAGMEFHLIAVLADEGQKAHVEKAEESIQFAIGMLKEADRWIQVAERHLGQAQALAGALKITGFPDANERILRCAAARACLRGEDGPGLRRRKAREKSAGETGDADSSLRSE